MDLELPGSRSDFFRIQILLKVSDPSGSTTLTEMVPGTGSGSTRYRTWGKKSVTLPVLKNAIPSYIAVTLRTFEINLMNLRLGFVQKKCAVSSVLGSGVIYLDSRYR